MITEKSIQDRISASNRRLRIVPIDVGRHQLALPADRLIGVRDDWRPLDDASFDTGLVVHSGGGPMRAINLVTWMGEAHSEANAPLVAVRVSEPESVMGLFVSHVGRPRTLRRKDLYEVPDWVAASSRIPLSHWAISSEEHSRQVLHIADVDRIRADEEDGRHQPSTNKFQGSEISTGQIEKQAAGRGVLAFAPAESSQAQMRCAIAIPMSLIVGVLADYELFEIPSPITQLQGLALWNGAPVPVIRLGLALGLGNGNTGGDGSAERSTRLLVLRTPGDRVIGCLTHSQMRTLRTPQTTGHYRDHKLDPEVLLGSFLTADGPVAIPDLDQVVDRLPEQMIARSTSPILS